MIAQHPPDGTVTHLTAQFTLSAFGDEIAADLDEQLRVLRSENIHHLELRGAWGKNIADFDADDLRRAERTLRDHDVAVSAIGSPIGKSQITEPFERELQRFTRILEIATTLGTPYIRIFSFFLPPDPHAHRSCRDEVLRRLERFADLALPYNITLLHENEKEIYGDTAVRCADLLNTIDAPNLKSAFDPANFVQCGIKPFAEAYPLLDRHIVYLHVKDARFADGGVVVAGAGDGEVAEVVQALRQHSFVGFASLEPHLSASGPFNGFTGPELFHEAVAAFRQVLDRSEVAHVS